MEAGITLTIKTATVQELIDKLKALGPDILNQPVYVCSGAITEGWFPEVILNVTSSENKTEGRTAIIHIFSDEVRQILKDCCDVCCANPCKCVRA